MIQHLKALEAKLSKLTVSELAELIDGVKISADEAKLFGVLEKIVCGSAYKLSPATVQVTPQFESAAADDYALAA